MADVQSAFPDLEVVLTVSRVEVVSGVEIETIKAALRWLYDEVQKRPVGQLDTSPMQTQLEELRKADVKQTASTDALRQQQEQLLQRSKDHDKALEAVQQLLGAVQELHASEQASSGFNEQLQAMTDAQIKMAQDIAALQSGQPSVRSPQAQQSGQQGASNINSDVQNSPDAVASPSGSAANSPATVIGTSGAASNSPGPYTGAGGAAAKSPATASTTTSTDGCSASLDQRLTALTAEVAQLRAEVSKMAPQSSSNSPAPSSQGAAASTSAATLAVSHPGGPSAQTEGRTASAKEGQIAAQINNQQNRLGQDSEARLANLAESLVGLQQQLAGQGNTLAELQAAEADLAGSLPGLRQQLAGQGNALAELQAAEAELRRLLADKAGLADVQAILQSSHAPALVPMPEGNTEEAGLAGALNGLGVKVGGLEGLLTLTQQRLADKADLAELDALREAIKRLRTAVGDEAVPSVVSGSAAGPDVVPAESDTSAPQALPAHGGRAATHSKGANVAASSLNARLATPERSMSAANKLTPGTRRTISMAPTAQLSSSFGAVAPEGQSSSSASSGAGSSSGSSADSEIRLRLAALEAQISHLTQPGSGMLGRDSARHDSSSVSAPGDESLQPVQAASALVTGRLSQLQEQVDALTAGKANKADLEALQLHAAVLSGGSSGNTSSGDGSTSSSGGEDKGSQGNADAGSMAGLLETVQRLLGSKADREELGQLQRALRDKINLADHQAAYDNLERSLLELQGSSPPIRPTAGLLGAAPIPAGKASGIGSPRGSRGPAGGSGVGAAGFTAVRPARRGIAQDENAVPSGDLEALREEVQQLKGVVEVLTNATHLMAIPTAAETTGCRTGDVAVTELIQGEVRPGSVPGTSATAVAGPAPAAAPAATAAAAAAAAIAGLGSKLPGEGAGMSKAGGLHLLRGASHLKQGSASSSAGLNPAQSPATGAAAGNGPAAPAPTPRADGRPAEALPHQSSGTGVEGGEVWGPLQELVSSMRAGQLGHKMNDSDIHDQLAQRLTNLEKLVKKLSLQPQGSRHIAGPVGGKGPDERLLRRLGSDLALVKRRLDEIAPPRDPGTLMMMREGDHAMLAGKPLQGYRCMACDRPLAKLDADMGGFVPGPHMPVSVSMEPSKNFGVVVPGKEGSGGRQGVSKRGPAPAQHSRSTVQQKGEDPVGPQNWFKDAQGQAAQALPKEDVGPHLPPGGWRAGTSQGSWTQAPKTSPKHPGSRTPGEHGAVAAWDTQASVPLPDIHAKPKA